MPLLSVKITPSSDGRHWAWEMPKGGVDENDFSVSLELGEETHTPTFAIKKFN
jgi:hypothetical protein